MRQPRDHDEPTYIIDPLEKSFMLGFVGGLVAALLTWWFI